MNARHPSKRPVFAGFCKIAFASVFAIIGTDFALCSAEDPGIAREPRVARVQMRLTFSEDLVDVIEKGDLLTVLEARDENFLIRSHSGRKGLVAKANAVSLAEAAEIYCELIESDPEEGRLYTLRGGALWAAGNADGALDDFDKAIELGYQEAHAYMSRGLFYAARGEQDKAIEDYTTAIVKDPKDVSPLINRAAAYILKGKVEDAIKDYDLAIEGRAKDAVLYQQRAVAFKALNKINEAIVDFTKAIEIAGPKTVAAIPPLMSRGFLHFQLGKHEEAIHDFGAVIEINPKATVAYNNRGYNMLQLGKTVEALGDYDKAIELEPKYGLAHQNRAWLLATADDKKIRDPKAAVESATKACELSEYQDVSDMAALAAASAANEEFEKAVGWQEKVIDKALPDQKPFAEKILELYVRKKPFDPKVANEFLNAANSSTKGSEPSESPEPPANKPKRAL
jgi:tetratricopeptide (TPR) repeat protein